MPSFLAFPMESLFRLLISTQRERPFLIGKGTFRSAGGSPFPPTVTSRSPIRTWPVGVPLRSSLGGGEGEGRCTGPEARGPCPQEARSVLPGHLFTSDMVRESFSGTFQEDTAFFAPGFLWLSKCHHLVQHPVDPWLSCTSHLLSA